VYNLRDEKNMSECRLFDDVGADLAVYSLVCEEFNYLSKPFAGL
jgi:hypothetical protein